MTTPSASPGGGKLSNAREAAAPVSLDAPSLQPLVVGSPTSGSRRSGSPSPKNGGTSPRLRGMAANISGLAGGMAKVLPIPKYVRLSQAPQRAERTLTSRPEKYIAPGIATLEASMTVIDYDMDEDDAIWLKAALANTTGSTLSEEGFEVLVNLCEKLSITAGRPVSQDEARLALEQANTPDKKNLLEWLQKVHAYWEAKLTRLRKPLLRWAPPVAPKAVPRARAANARSGARGSMPGRAQPGASSREEPRVSRERQSKNTPHGAFYIGDQASKTLPNLDVALLAKGCSAVLPTIQLTQREFTASAVEGSGQSENLDTPTVEKYTALQRRLEAERKSRIIAEKKVQQLSQVDTVSAQNHKRIFDARIEEYDRALQTIEGSLDEIEAEEAGLRRKFEEEKRRGEAERKKYEHDRRERMAREQENERQRKKMGRERAVLDKKMREHEVLKRMMEAQIRDGFHKWRVEQEVANAVDGLLTDCEAMIMDGEIPDPVAVEKTIQAGAQNDMQRLKSSIESDFNSWKVQYLKASHIFTPFSCVPKPRTPTACIFLFFYNIVPLFFTGLVSLEISQTKERG